MEELTTNVTEEVIEAAGNGFGKKAGIVALIAMAGYGVGKGVEKLVKVIRTRKAEKIEAASEEVEVEILDED